MIGNLLDFFTGGPARIQALLISALVMLVVILALVVYGEFWRGEAFKARDQVDQVRTQLVAERDQVQILAGAVKACNAGVDAAKAAGDRAQSWIDQALAILQAAAGDHAAASARIETLIKARPAGANLTCRDAWKAIEAQRKAGAVP